MSTPLPSKNDPAARADIQQFLQPTVFEFVFTTTNIQIAYFDVAPSFRPYTMVFSDYTQITLEVTASSVANIKADSANWFTVTLTSNLWQFNTPLTAVRLTSSAACNASLVQ